MKNIDLTKSAFVALLLVSTVAGAEDKYPASDFQPKVVYQDESAASGESSAPASKPASTSSSASSGSDAQYPAANFEPKVLYSDSDYKHTASSPGSSSSSYSSLDSGATASAAAPAAEKSESSAGYLLGLIVLGIAGFVLFKKGAVNIGGGQKNRPAASAPRSAGGLTGVARYVLKTSGTGVQRYLEKNTKASVSASATGVAKYLASKGSSAKPAGSQAATGVEKYMRNKG